MDGDNLIEVDFAPARSIAERLEANQRSAKEKLAGVQRDLDVLLADEQRRIREARMWESWQRRRLFERIRRLRDELRAERASQFDDEAVYVAAVEEAQDTGREVAAKAVAARLLKYPTHSAFVRIGHAFSRLERAGKVRRVAPSGSSSGYRWLVEVEEDA